MLITQIKLIKAKFYYPIQLATKLHYAVNLATSSRAGLRPAQELVCEFGLEQLLLLFTSSPCHEKRILSLFGAGRTAGTSKLNGCI